MFLQKQKIVSYNYNKKQQPQQTNKNQLQNKELKNKDKLYSSLQEKTNKNNEGYIGFNLFCYRNTIYIFHLIYNIGTYNSNYNPIYLFLKLYKLHLYSIKEKKFLAKNFIEHPVCRKNKPLNYKTKRK